MCLMHVAGYRNQRINGPVNAHLISGPSINTKHTFWIKMAELTVNLITHNLSFTSSVYYTNQIAIISKESIVNCHISHCKSLTCKI